MQRYPQEQDGAKQVTPQEGVNRTYPYPQTFIFLHKLSSSFACLSLISRIRGPDNWGHSGFNSMVLREMDPGETVALSGQTRQCVGRERTKDLARVYSRSRTFVTHPQLEQWTETLRGEKFGARRRFKSPLNQGVRLCWVPCA